MENFVRMAGIQSVLFVYMLVGWGCRKSGLLKAEARPAFTEFVVNIALPCMIFNSFQTGLTAEDMKQGALALLIATVVATAALLIGRIAYNWVQPRERCILQYGTLVSNAGFAGLPVIESAYGAEGLFLGSLAIIPTRILMWSAGISLFTEAPLKQRVKNVLLNPGIIAVELGLIKMFTGLTLPGFLNKSVTALGGCTTPLAMAIVGMILADVDVRSVLEPKAFLLTAVRQIALPFALLAVLKALAVDPLTLGVSVVLTGMPIGSTTAILAAKYGADAEFGSKCVFISTLASLITVPILTVFL
ncbi:MAG: AEC family transporter [Oscillospiraceae bacterium]|nr:AEC family transporter [Oscillospiraceae bacterium]